MAEVKLKQVRSAAGSNAKQRGALESLKLGRIGRSSTMEDTPQLRGALIKVGHLLEIDGVTAPRGFVHDSDQSTVAGRSEAKDTGGGES